MVTQQVLAVAAMSVSPRQPQSDGLSVHGGRPKLACSPRPPTSGDCDGRWRRLPPAWTGDDPARAPPAPNGFPKASRWLEQLKVIQRHVPGSYLESVIDDLCTDKWLQEQAQQKGFGVYILRKGVPEKMLQVMEQKLVQTFKEIQAETLKKSTVGNVKKLSEAYSSFQSVDRTCTCSYKYESTALHPTYKFGNFPWGGQDPTTDFVNQVHMGYFQDVAGVADGASHAFNLYVANMYSLAHNQHIGWHDDWYPLMDNPFRGEDLQYTGAARPRADGTAHESWSCHGHAAHGMVARCVVCFPRID